MKNKKKCWKSGLKKLGKVVKMKIPGEGMEFGGCLEWRRMVIG